MKREIILAILVLSAVALFAGWSEPIYVFSYIEEDCDTPWSIRDVALVPSVNPGNDTLLYLLAEGMPFSIVRIRSGKFAMIPFSQVKYYSSTLRLMVLRILNLGRTYVMTARDYSLRQFGIKREGNSES